MTNILVDDFVKSVHTEIETVRVHSTTLTWHMNACHFLVCLNAMCLISLKIIAARRLSSGWLFAYFLPFAMH